MSTETVLREGKTKLIIDDCHTGDKVPTVLMRSKDDVTDEDGARVDLFDGKAALATRTTANCFRQLNKKGLPNHFVEEVDATTLRVASCEMIPVEMVARRIATGSYLNRYPHVSEGIIFSSLMVEFFRKDDVSDVKDPLMVFDPVSDLIRLYHPRKPNSEGLLREIPGEDYEGFLPGEDFEIRMATLSKLVQMTEVCFLALEEAWKKQGVALVDIKIECGMSDEDGKLLVADVIDNDNWRIWPDGERANMLDKQVYRELAGVEDPAAKAREMGEIKKNYEKVANMTDLFVS